MLHWQSSEPLPMGVKSKFGPRCRGEREPLCQPAFGFQSAATSFLGTSWCCSNRVRSVFFKRLLILLNTQKIETRRIAITNSRN